MLKLEHVKTGYGSMPVVHDASFHVKAGTIMALLGSNGSGKTSLLRAIFGTLPIMAGAIEYKGQSIVGTKSYRMVEMGISMVPEGRHLFGKMSVRDNLVMGAYSVRDKEEIERRLQSVFQMFPRVEERQRQQADTLSGGEQQMVAIARGLMCSPELLILDEPSLGLMPKLVSEIFSFITKIKESGVTVIIVEQNASATLEMCDYAYVMQNGETVLEGTGAALLADEQVKKAYLGG
ncbi:MAG: ABC transporter ATP-binding protein [Lawsonibacter sp.]|jgi:branched-chain amino acid transport system ATP-binding protein|uniref:ABC transporter ATP-binding protein n=1 Tax=Lawsonibacter sp. JLR.KK007 TaxID=3114293 RepID=UPI002171EE77|nr:ABC transporter ATP-binding protein [Lawsonibacter sp.]